MCAKMKQEAQNPLILRCHRLMEAFAKSDDERDFYIDRLEGFLIYIDLDKPQEEIGHLQKELELHADRYCPIPKLSYYETKKIMEGFVNEKVYDIDTKEKLLDIIQSKEARENFLEFIYDHHSEQEKWQQFYQERSRIRIIEWLRLNHFHFVFEEDLDLPGSIIEKLKHALFVVKVGKDIQNARKALVAKAKTYYSSEALNPRPKRGRPPKQAAKPEIEPQVTVDIYTTIPAEARPFVFSPEINTSSAFSIFSSKFDSEEEHLLSKRFIAADADTPLHLKLASLRTLSSKWIDTDSSKQAMEDTPYAIDNTFDDSDDDDDEDFEDDEGFPVKSRPGKKALAAKKPKGKVSPKSKVKPVSKPKAKPAPKPKAKIAAPVSKKAKPSKPVSRSPAKAPIKKSTVAEKPKAKRIMPKTPPAKTSSGAVKSHKTTPKKK